MATRANRPRAGPPKEDPPATEEERRIWHQIMTDVRRASELQKRSAECVRLAIDMEATIGDDPTNDQIEELKKLYREGSRTAEEENKILQDEPCDVIKNIGLLAALRCASQHESHNAQASKPRSQKNKPRIDMDGAADSPGLPSTLVNPSVAKGTGVSVRSGSVPSTKDLKEPSVKTEDGSEGGKGPSAEKAGKFFVGAEVAYKQVKMKEDGSQWIQCTITSILELGGNKKRYEVQDPEPEENGAPGQIYKTYASALIAIPGPDAILADYPIGKHVLARYPETTTFYRAVVTGVKKDICRLKFEDDQEKEMEVARRFVLDLNTK